MDRQQRIQLKKFILGLGILLLLLLLTVRVVQLLKNQGKPEREEKIFPIHIPKIEKLSNVWILEAGKEGITIFCDGEQRYYTWYVQKSPEAEGGQEQAGEEQDRQKKDDWKQDGEEQDRQEQDELKQDGQKKDNQKQDGEEQDAQEQNGQNRELYREQLADITLWDNQVTQVSLKTERINGRVLRAGEDFVEIEGYGKLPLREDYKGYRLYDKMQMCTTADLLFGYADADFCLEAGEICGILMVKEEAMEYIRVLLKASDGKSIFQSEPQITADTSFTVIYGGEGERRQEVFQAGEVISLTYASDFFSEGDRVEVVPEVLTGKVKINNLERNQGVPSYRGKLELLRTEEGIVAINEVLLEEYLYSVVPSEMPARYPKEALRAQAVCARTYAYGHMLHAGYPRYGAHVDDSTAYQVYQNIKEQENSTTAVKETYGQLLFTAGGELAQTFYYSTSCGVGSDATVWKTQAAEEIDYIQGKEISRTGMKNFQALNAGQSEAAVKEPDADRPDTDERASEQSAVSEETFTERILSINPDDFEAEEGWYRWSYQVEKLDVAHLKETLQKRYAANEKLILTKKTGKEGQEEYESCEIGKITEVKDIRVEKRGAGGVADELILETDAGTIKVISEHNIRYVLNNGKEKAARQDGSLVECPTILPSGFFVITTGKEKGNVVGYTLTGGGFGHGVGMSQNGARHMAEEGYRAEDILGYFYNSCVLKNIYE